MPGAPLRSASIQFPDPHFKAKHHKRRVVQPELARSHAYWPLAHYHLPPTTHHGPITTSHCTTYHHFPTSHLLLTTTTYHIPLTTHLSPLTRREPSPRASRRAAGSSCSLTCSSSPRRCARRVLTATLTPIPTPPKPKPKPKPNQVLREHACGPGVLVDARDDIDDWSVAKPAELANLPTERENACVSKGLPVYRALFSRAV